MSLKNKSNNSKMFLERIRELLNVPLKDNQIESIFSQNISLNELQRLISNKLTETTELNSSIELLMTNVLVIFTRLNLTLYVHLKLNGFF